MAEDRDLFLFGDDLDAVLEALEADDNVDEYFGNCEEQLPLTNCRSTVGRQITDTLPTGYRQFPKTEILL